jgi:hypothetical protein
MGRASHPQGDGGGGVRLDHPLQNISHQQKQIWGEGIALPQPPLAVDPSSRDSIEKDSRPLGVNNGIDPITPKLGKPRTSMIVLKLRQSTESKAFAKSSLKTRVRALRLKQVCTNSAAYTKKIRDAPSSQKTRLVHIHQVANLLLKVKREAFLKGLCPRGNNKVVLSYSMFMINVYFSC